MVSIVKTNTNAEMEDNEENRSVKSVANAVNPPLIVLNYCSVKISIFV